MMKKAIKRATLNNGNQIPFSMEMMKEGDLDKKEIPQEGTSLDQLLSSENNEKPSRKRRKSFPAPARKRGGWNGKEYKTTIAPWIAERQTDTDQGYSVTDASWYPIEHISRGAPALSKEELKNFTAITAERACKMKGITLSRALDVDLSGPALQAVQSAMEATLGEYDPLVLELCESGEVHKCGLFMKPTQEITLLSTDHILYGEPIGVFTGILQARPPTPEESSPEEVIAHLWDFDLPRESLPEFYKGVDLVVQTKIKGNETRFLNDANPNDLELGPEVVERAPNVHPRLAWHQKKKLPYIVFVAVCHIAPNCELFLDWGKNCRRELNQFQLESLAQKSHFYHRWAATLQNLLLKHNLPLIYFDPDEKADEHSKRAEILKEGAGYSLLSQASETNGTENGTEDSEDEEALGDTQERVNDFCQPMYAVYGEDGQAVHFQDVDPTEAYLKSNCQLLRECKLELLPETREKLEKACEMNSLDYTAQMKKIIRDGTTPNCSIKEIIDLHHPCRLYTRPDKPAYALITTKKIKEKQPIGVYSGIYKETQRFHQNGSAWWQQVYAYDVLQHQIGDEYDGPDLVVESLVMGNECRFINDAYGRSEGLKAVNAEATIVWDKKRSIPAVVLTACKAIPKDDEIVVDYGEEFWRKVVPILLSEHRVFLEKAQDFCEKMKNVLIQNSVPIPLEPSRDMKHVPIFNPAGVAYYPRTTATSRVYTPTWTPLFNSFRCTTRTTLKTKETKNSTSEGTPKVKRKRNPWEFSQVYRPTKRQVKAPEKYVPPYGRRRKKKIGVKQPEKKHLLRARKTLGGWLSDLSTRTITSTCGKTLQLHVNVGLGTCEFLDLQTNVFYAPCPIGRERHQIIQEIKSKIFVRDEDIKPLLQKHERLRSSFRERKNLLEHTLYPQRELYNAVGILQAEDLTRRDAGLVRS